MLLLEIEMVVIGAAGIESGLAVRTDVVATKVAGNAESVVAVAAVDGFGMKLGLGPDLGGVTHGFLVALDAGVELTATLVLDGNEVALGVVVGALSARVYGSAKYGNGSSRLHFYESNRSTCSTPFTRLKR